MINQVETEIIQNYVKESKQERLLWELSSPSKRETIIWKFAGSELFKRECLLPTKYMPADAMEQYFSKLTKNNHVYFIGADYIGQLTLQQAVQRAQEGEICIVYCGNGNGYYQGEQSKGAPPRYLLSVR